jgi:hypothetical protein
MKWFLGFGLCLSFLLHTEAFLQPSSTYQCRSMLGTAQNARKLRPQNFQHYDKKDRSARSILFETRMNDRSVNEARRYMGFRNNMFFQMRSLMPFNDMGWLVPAIGVGTWLFLATLSFEQIEGWQPGESFFYVIDTGLCRGFGSVKPATALGQVQISSVISRCTSDNDSMSPISG